MPTSTAVDANALARVLGIKVEQVNFGEAGTVYLPQRVMVFGQGNSGVTYPSEKEQVFDDLSVANKYGFGSPLHLSVLQLLPPNGDGVGTLPVTVFPLQEEVGAVASTGDITVTGTATKAGALRAVVNNIPSAQFVIKVGDTASEVSPKIVAAIQSVLAMPITAADNLGVTETTSKWKGETANEIFIEIIGDDDTGLVFAVTQHTGGLVNPTVDDALAKIGNVWETMGVNCLGEDTTALDTFSTFNEGRWGSLVRKPFVICRGGVETDVNTAITVPDARKTDRTNVKLMEVAGNDLSWVIAARQLARIAKLANNNPPHDYGSQRATGLTPGADEDQWQQSEKEAAFQGGCSTSDSIDSEVVIADVITHYHPTGEVNPGYRYVVDLVKIWNFVFNIDLTFAVQEWDGAPLIPDEQTTTNPTAKKPKTAVAAAANVVRNLGLDAILADVETTIPLIRANINETNPKRLDMVIPGKLGGNTNVKSFDVQFGFFFGSAQIAA